MTSDDIFVVGYGGWTIMHYEPANTAYYNGPDVGVPTSFLDGTLVQVTGANVTRSLNVPTVNGYFLPFNGIGEVKSLIRVAFGVYAFQGSISFDLTEGTAKDLFDENFYRRNALFSLQFFDGHNTCTLRNCVWSSVSLSFSPEGTVKVNISFQSNNGYLDDLVIVPNDANDDVEYDDSDFLVPYWQCGHENFSEFSVEFSRQVTPVYLNNDLKVPSYLRPGLVEISLSASTLVYVENWSDVIRLEVGRSHFITLNGAVLKSTQYSTASMNDAGMKSYEWSSIADRATDPVFTVGSA